MRATILPQAIVLAKAFRARVSIMAKGCVGVCGLPLMCFIFLLPNIIIVYVIIMQYFLHIDKRGLLQQEYSQPSKLPSTQFLWAVNLEITDYYNILSQQPHQSLNPHIKPIYTVSTNLGRLVAVYCIELPVTSQRV